MASPDNNENNDKNSGPETNDSFAKVNEELAASSKEVKLIREQVKHHSRKQRELIQNASDEIRSSIRSTLESL